VYYVAAATSEDNIFLTITSDISNDQTTLPIGT
jgi:hypothetical protein